MKVPPHQWTHYDLVSMDGGGGGGGVRLATTT